MTLQPEPGTFQLGVRVQPHRYAQNADETFRILVLGDFGGRRHRAEEEREPQSRPLRPILVSRDNISDLPGRFAAQCSVVAADDAEQAELIRFSRLADFHPDLLLDRVPALIKLRVLRERLLQGGTFEKAAEEVRRLGIVGIKPTKIKPEINIAETQPPTSNKSPRLAAGELASGENLLEQAILQTNLIGTLPPSQSSSQSGLPEGLAELVRNSTAELRVPQTPSSAPALIEAVESAIAERLRSILHDPTFQALEAAWRGLDFLVKRLPTGPKLKVYMVDLGFDSLKFDLASADSLESTAFYELLVSQTVGTPGGEPWSLIAADYTVQASKVDLLVAGCMAHIAAQAGAPLIAAASDQLFGCPSLVQYPDPIDWKEALPEDVANALDTLRSRAESDHLGLVAPRFLLRMPYGVESSPLASLPFNELPDPTAHEGYLWGNGSLACAVLMGEAFAQDGTRMQLEPSMTLDGLPIYGTDHDGEYYLQPCAETLLSYRAAEQMLAAGVMPLLTIRDTGSAQLAAWQSVAANGAPLVGRWA